MRKVIDTKAKRKATIDQEAAKASDLSAGRKLTFFLLVSRLIILAHARIDALFSGDADPMTPQASVRLDKLKSIRQGLAAADSKRDDLKARAEAGEGAKW